MVDKKPASHPAELAEDLPRPRPGRGWPAVRGVLEIAELFEEEDPRLVPASYMTTRSHQMFEYMVRTHESSSTSSFQLCFMFSDAPTSRGLPRFPPHEGMVSAPRPLP